MSISDFEFTLNQGMAIVTAIGSGVLSWFTLVLLETPKRFKVTDKQKIALGFVFAMAILGWFRLYFTLRYNE